MIPEPMVFDMNWPVAAPKGEFEANTLALLPLNARGEEIDWAPEIEYAFATGWAVEFEPPLENARSPGRSAQTNQRILRFDHNPLGRINFS